MARPLDELCQALNATTPAPPSPCATAPNPPVTAHQFLHHVSALPRAAPRLRAAGQREN
jgi:hypothetical protein